MAGIDNNSGRTGIDLPEGEAWHRRVRVRAYEIWELEGHHSDRTEENWLRAAQEIVDAADTANELMLATAYREAAAGDAWHERDNTGTAQGGQDWSLAVTPEVPGVPLTMWPIPIQPMARITLYLQARKGRHMTH